MANVPRLMDLDDKAVLVTGGTGSFGRRFIETVLARYSPSRLIVFSRDEMKQHEMAASLSPDDHPSLRFFIGDIRDAERLTMAMAGVDIVVHAAALKVVPTAEYNPFECIKTNVYGTENVVRAAMASGVEKVIGLSTDKAVAPINLYGATKLAAEKLLVAANNLAGETGPRFSIARYGNVVGSRGSVIPFFRRLIENGADHLPITDDRMTRFWITLDQGVEFVLSCLEMMHGGEIFVPKLHAVHVVDLANVMAPDLPHRIVGIRPGEKVHEALVSFGEVRSTIELEDRYLIHPPITFWHDRVGTPIHGTPVPPSFTYESDNPELRMEPESISALVK